MNYYELKITLKLKQDIYFDEVAEKLSILINKSMLYDEYLKSIHKINSYKFYVFEGLRPIEKDKTYKKGAFYMTTLRCIDEFMAEAFRTCLKNVSTDKIDVLAIDLEKVVFTKVKKIFNITPAVATINSEYWKSGMDISIIKNSINVNILKKIKVINGVDDIIDYDMIEFIQVKNTKPISFKYKQNKFLGNKFEIVIKEDEMSQLMAYIAISTGILEKNSLGYGYCLAKN